MSSAVPKKFEKTCAEEISTEPFIRLTKNPATAAAPPTNADSIIIPSAGNTANSTRNITGGKININTASEKELVELPGVGPSTAQKIIRYRQENGAFSTIDEIKNVRGIGDGKFAKMKDLIKT